MISIKLIVSSVCSCALPVLCYNWGEMRHCGLSACTSGTQACGLEVVPMGSGMAVEEVHLNNARYIPNGESAFSLYIMTRLSFHVCCW